VDTPKFLNTAEAAELLHLRPQTLRKLRASGRGPQFVRIGAARTGRVLYKSADLDSWVAERTFRSTEDEAVSVAPRRAQRTNP
jgi:hypothetical protein